MQSDDMFGELPLDERMVLDELRRELLMRRNVYPKWIRNGKIDEETATRRIRCMELAIQYIEGMP